MKTMTKGLLASLLLMPAAAFAGDEGAISYTYIQGGYTSITTDVGNTEVDSDGWYAGGSFLVAPNFYVFGSYNDTTSDTSAVSLEATGFNAGLGVRMPVTDYADFNLAAAYVRSDSDYTGVIVTASGEEDGYSVSAGFRAALGKCLELDAGYTYADVADDSGAFDIGGVVNIWKGLSATAAYRFGDDANAWTAGARFNF